jgi:hypothetical protein
LVLLSEACLQRCEALPKLVYLGGMKMKLRVDREPFPPRRVEDRKRVTSAILALDDRKATVRALPTGFKSKRRRRRGPADADTSAIRSWREIDHVADSPIGTHSSCDNEVAFTASMVGDIATDEPLTALAFEVNLRGVSGAPVGLQRDEAGIEQKAREAPCAPPPCSPPR